MFYQLTLLAVTTVPTEEAGLADTVNGISEKFKIYPELFFPQLISFLIVAILLKKFAFGPIQEMLEQRKQRIADGEAKLIEIEKQLADSAKHTAEVVEKANADAKRMIEEAKASASNIVEQKTQEAISSAQQIISKAEAAAQAERAQIAAELKREFGRLVADTAQNATAGKLTADQQRAINDDALRQVQA
ncbi:MAG: ATP synthase F0 subunit B [Verrucomicrobia bacterium]|jgi:F-type H+-transporting ATPase subunit b|nr:MAG: ATP synthase F0 subunit B [Verrucomicrobiota bacterium]